MTEIIGYEIATAYNSTELAKSVQQMIADGWQPYGPMVISDSAGMQYTYNQPMVLYVKKESLHPPGDPFCT